MITEDYCSFEVAKLLKEKGFDVPLWFYYDQNKEITLASWSEWEEDWNNCLINNEPSPFISAPTHQMAMAWLREVHNIFIVISPISCKGYGAILCDVGDFDDCYYLEETDYFFHPEEATEAALKYTLENLI